MNHCGLLSKSDHGICRNEYVNVLKAFISNLEVTVIGLFQFKNEIFRIDLEKNSKYIFFIIRSIRFSDILGIKNISHIISIKKSRSYKKHHIR